MEIATIHDEATYDLAMAELRRFWGAAPGTPDGDYLDSLMDMVDDWETRAGAYQATATLLRRPTPATAPPPARYNQPPE